VVLANDVNPGDKFQIVFFGVNGPISVAPMNFVPRGEDRIFSLKRFQIQFPAPDVGTV
jgi:hypothetical protein